MHWTEIKFLLDLGNDLELDIDLEVIFSTDLTLKMV